MGKGRPTRKPARLRGPAPHKRAAARRAPSAAGTSGGQATETATGPAASPAASPTASQAADDVRPRLVPLDLPGDELLPPRDRGAVRAYVRDVVDSRRRLLGFFMPVFAMALITTVGPASELGRNLQLGSLAILAVMAVEAVYLALTISRMARAEFPGATVNTAATGWYIFMRAHHLRSTRRPAPRVTPGRP